MPNPPIVGDMLLRAVLPPASAEAMTGDLLEEYRDARVPAVGSFRADVWYLRQAAGVFLRAYGWFVVPLILAIVVHDVFNGFRDAAGASYLDRLPGAAAAASAMPGVGIAALLAAAVYGTWRTGQWVGGLVAAFGLFVVTWLSMAMWWAVTLYPFALAQQHNPYWIQAWQWSIHRQHPPALLGFNPDTPDESFLRWIFWDNVGASIIAGMVMAAVSTICGVVGSTMCWMYRRESVRLP